VQALEYLRTRSAKLGAAGIRERVRAAAQELENAVAAAPDAGVRQRPLADRWNISEVVDHIAQTQIRAAEELRHLMAGRRPPGPPVYEGLRSAAAVWAPWAELVEGLRSANRELIALLESPPADGADGPTAHTILVVNRTLPDGRVTPQIFVAELGWKEYALVQRVHLLEHRNQIKKLCAALAGS
jgi:hypothetical protein